MKKRKNSVRASLALAAATLLLGAGAHAAPKMTPLSLLGDKVPVEVAQRTIQIDPGTTYVNVDRGEVVKFVAGGKQFAFNFDSGSVSSFDLERVAPPGALTHPVTVYLSEGATDPYIH